MAQAHQKQSKKSLVGVFVARPRLMWAFLAGVAVLAALRLATELDWFIAGVLAWNAMCLTFALIVVRVIVANNTPRRHPGQGRHPGRGEGGDPRGGGGRPGWRASGRSGSSSPISASSTGWTRACGWRWRSAPWRCPGPSCQLVFAMHYAHEYYGPKAMTRSPEGHGLGFPGGGAARLLGLRPLRGG